MKMKLGKSSSKAKAVRKQSVNCTTVTSKYPLFSQSLESWYGKVGECCITGESRMEVVVADKAMEYSLKHYMWSPGFKEKALRWQRQGPFESEGHFDGKGVSMAKVLRRQIPSMEKARALQKAEGPFDGKLQRALGRQRRRRFEREDCSKAKTL